MVYDVYMYMVYIVNAIFRWLSIERDAQLTAVSDRRGRRRWVFPPLGQGRGVTFDTSLLLFLSYPPPYMPLFGYYKWGFILFPHHTPSHPITPLSPLSPITPLHSVLTVYCINVQGLINTIR